MDTYTKNEVMRMMKLQAQLSDDAFKALFEVLELTPEQIERFHSICDQKMYERHDQEKKVSEKFNELLKEKIPNLESE
jgi:Spy/CpxP family protein refolding chaperone